MSSLLLNLYNKIDYFQVSSPGLFITSAALLALEEIAVPSIDSRGKGSLKQPLMLSEEIAVRIDIENPLFFSNCSQ